MASLNPTIPVILYRRKLGSLGPEDQEEFDAARSVFTVATRRTSSIVLCSSLPVIGRYSVLPFYGELHDDLRLHGSRLVNSPVEHAYIADFEYYEDLVGLTPKTWFTLSDAIREHNGPFVLKGRTNSRKMQFREKMVAMNCREAVDLHRELSNDPTIGPQGIIVREMLNLRILEPSVAGPPFANEWRCFFYKGRSVADGYYWSGASEGTSEIGRPAFEALGRPFAQWAADILKERTNFFAVDVAELADGSWTVIEVNDGQMSGLSDIPPLRFYEGLRSAIVASREDEVKRGVL